MNQVTYEVPYSLGIRDALQICGDLANIQEADKYAVDFSRTQHFEPCGMLMVASAVRRLASRGETVVTGCITGKQGHDYAHRLGFWWSLGDTQDLPAVKRDASETTIPVTRIGLDDLYKKSGGADPVRSHVVSDAAADLATTLCGSRDDSLLWYALEYSFAELFRNTIEHSQAGAIWYCAATRPTKNDIQIAVADGGIGIRKSLSRNPAYNHDTDEAALRDALRGGVSRNSGVALTKEQRNHIRSEFRDQDPEYYQNAGYGLTLTSELGKAAGQFSIVSGDCALSYVGQTEVVANTSHSGTAVRLTVNPSLLPNAMRKVDIAASKAPRRASSSLLTASGRLRIRRARP